jgi:glycosyltransferase involved in cell wall biosynthesis
MKKVQLKPEEISTIPIVMDGTYRGVPVARRIAIAMATYNGGRFIEEQIRSIQLQSHSDWMLYIRDDASKDDTVLKILQIECKDSRVKLVRDKLGNQGAIGNFSTLMEVALEENAEYLFFADQDDVWQPDKLTIMLGAMEELELKYGEQTPLLVHCDLSVVNETLQPIAHSFVKYSRLSPTSAELGVLLCQNQVTGCACAINRTLLELACPVPRNALMHDWWLALLASSAGKIGFIPQPLVMYRQHAGNVLGAVSLGRRLKELLFSLRQWKLRMEVVRGGFVQAAMLEERIKARGIELLPYIQKQIHTYSQILDVSPFKRVSKLHAQKIGRSASSTRLVYNLLITALRRKQEAKTVA